MLTRAIGQAGLLHQMASEKLKNRPV